MSKHPNWCIENFVYSSKDNNTNGNVELRFWLLRFPFNMFFFGKFVYVLSGGLLSLANYYQNMNLQKFQSFQKIGKIS